MSSFLEAQKSIDESSQLLSNDPSPVSSSKKWLTMPRGIIILLTIGMASLAPRVEDFFRSSSSSLQTTNGRSQVQFSVHNEYTSVFGPAGSDYPWLQETGRFLVEPNRVSNLAVQGNPDGHDVTWAISRLNEISEEWEPDITIKGTHVNVTFPAVGHYKITVQKLSVEDATLISAVSGELICRYVRRELRALNDHEREQFFASVQIMMDHNFSLGQAKYGSRYRPLDFFSLKHLALAADRKSDKMHDGMGFLTNHLALSLEFEDALQAIYPNLALPYWDFTIDSYEVNVTHNGNWDSLWEGIVWSPQWFGLANPDNHTVTEGRWAWTKVSNAKDLNSSVHNAYGYMRAPWNVNKSPYVTRGHQLCGASAFDFDGFPTCDTHLKYVDETFTTWYDWVWGASYAPHGPVHVVIGGTQNCADDYDALLDTIGEVSMSQLKTASFYSLKSAWRVHIVECPDYCASDTPQKECSCHCPGIDDLAVDKKVFKDLLLGLNLGTIIDLNAYDHDVVVKMLKMLCTTGTIPGDQLEAASPVDITFWPIHPTIERLFQWKKLQADFESELWSSSIGGTTKYCQLGGCEGHHGYDILPYEIQVKNSDSGIFEYNQLSNAELLAAANPSLGMMPYIYDNFEWKHCSELGVKMRLKDAR